VVPENELWWGKGFTDWVNVKRARSLFPGHYQPRAPLDGDYYDLTHPGVIERQVDMARQYGLEAFCHYHYWFEGRRLLERPTEMFLSNRSIQFGFCLAWANASWSRRWTSNGRSGRDLIKQTYSSDQRGWMDHFECLFKSWTDPRHLCVEGKPVFLIYLPQDIPETARWFDLWRNEAVRRGLPGLHLVAMQHFPFAFKEFLSCFDAVTLAEPGAALFLSAKSDSGLLSSITRLLRGLPSRVAAHLERARTLLPGRLRIHDYDDLWSNILELRSSEPRHYPGAFVDFDNTPRYERTARIVKNAAPEKFRYWFAKLVDSLQSEQPERRLIFVNAWNEWAEGAYLEPDEKHGYGYLEAIQDAVRVNSASDSREPA